MTNKQSVGTFLISDPSHSRAGYCAHAHTLDRVDRWLSSNSILILSKFPRHACIRTTEDPSQTNPLIRTFIPFNFLCMILCTLSGTVYAIRTAPDDTCRHFECRSVYFSVAKKITQNICFRNNANIMHVYELLLYGLLLL